MDADVAEPVDASLVAPTPERSIRGEVMFWAAHLMFWVASFVVTRVIVGVFRPEIVDPPALAAIETLLCFSCTAAMRWLSLQESLLSRLGISKIGVIAGGSILSAVFVTLAQLVVGRSYGIDPTSRLELIARFMITLSNLGNWCAIYFGSQLIRERNTTEVRALRAESAALKNELARLQGQISPHFLFNALNTVLALRKDPDAIETVTQALADYLRFLLRPSDRLEPLARELDALEQYLTVQGLRFGDGLVTRIECDLAARSVLVPPVMVQPLVENAIKYGGESAERPVRVDVTARREPDGLVIDVANTGSWVAPGGAQSTGTGLHSLERRLQLLVGPGARVTSGEENGWVRVRIRMPIPQRSEIEEAS